jgi:hypothetical protein
MAFWSRWLRLFCHWGGYQFGITPWFDVFLWGPSWYTENHRPVQRRVFMVELAGHMFEVGH